MYLRIANVVDHLIQSKPAYSMICRLTLNKKNYLDTGWSVRNVSKTFVNQMSCNALYESRRVAKFLWGLDILIFDFQNTQKNKKLVKIEVCEEIVRFSNISENTKENINNFPDGF